LKAKTPTTAFARGATVTRDAVLTAFPAKCTLDPVVARADALGAMAMPEKEAEMQAMLRDFKTYRRRS
jgi:hypothetical protein